MVRDRWPNDRVFTYWDYRAGMFHQDLGMRIDLVLASATVADRVAAAWVDRYARKGNANAHSGTSPNEHELAEPPLERYATSGAIDRESGTEPETPFLLRTRDPSGGRRWSGQRVMNPPLTKRS